MSIKTVDHPQVQLSTHRELLPLNSGDRLSRAEFERRYEAHPKIKKAELIEGVVYVSAPIRYKQHANPHFGIITWLGNYQASRLFQFLNAPKTTNSLRFL